MLTTGKTRHYCKHCGFDMSSARLDRMCVACDGDVCEASARAPLRELKKDHPRVIAEHGRWIREGCKHRPECLKFSEHLRRTRS